MPKKFLRIVFAGFLVLLCAHAIGNPAAPTRIEAERKELKEGIAPPFGQAAKKCLAGDDEDCLSLQHHPQASLEKLKSVFTQLRKRCESGTLFSCYVLGDLQKNYSSTAQDAKAIFKKLCDQNDNLGCVGLGRQLVREGKGKDAYPFLLKSCLGGFKSACSQAFKHIQDNNDLEKILDQMKGACENGAKDDRRRGCYDLGVIWLEFNHLDLAERSFEKACRADSIESCVVAAHVALKRKNGKPAAYKHFTLMCAIWGGNKFYQIIHEFDDLCKTVTLFSKYTPEKWSLIERTVWAQNEITPFTIGERLKNIKPFLDY